MVLKDFLFLNSTSGATSESLWIAGNGSQVTVQVTGDSTINLQAQGMLDGEAETWVNVSVVRMDTIKVASTITAAGLYIVPCNSYKAIRFVNNGTAGSVKVYGSLA